MKKWFLQISVVLVVLIGVVLVIQNTNRVQSEPKKELTIFAASSLTDVMRELTDQFQKEYPSVEFVLNFASSGSLQIQIEQGAPADIFASAGIKQMNALSEKKLVKTDSVKNFAANQLVVIAPVASEFTIHESTDLLQKEVQQISIGDPASTPIGQYSKEALENLQLWESVERKLVYGSNVRQILQYVERGEVNLGFVYSTDALTSDQVKVLWTVPPTSYRPIKYPIGIVAESKQYTLAEEFIRWVTSSTGQEILSRYGFAPTN